MNPSTAPLVSLPQGAELLQAGGGDGTGNRLLLFRGEGLLLKLYRTRGSVERERLRSLSHRLFERRRGATAPDRGANEQATLDVWAREGFDAPRPIDRPLPPGIDPPALWMEYCEGPLLDELLGDDDLSLDHKLALVRGFAASLSRRQHRALELREPLLVHGHATTKHVIVRNGRFIVFDFETAYRSGAPMKDFLVTELAGYLRPLLRAGGPHADAFAASFAEGYGDLSLLRELAEGASSGRSLLRRIKRWSDIRRRAQWSKTEVCARVLRAISKTAPALLACLSLCDSLHAQDADQSFTLDSFVREWSAWPDPLHIESILAGNYTYYDERNVRDSGFRMDRAVIRFQGAGEEWSFRVAPDLVGIDTDHGLEEAWAAWRRTDALRTTLGLFKVPLGAEYAIPEEDLSFVGYSFAAYLDGRTDLGVLLDGELKEGLFSYESSAVAGVGFDPQGQERNEPQASFRFQSYPFRLKDWLSPVLPGVFIGAAFAYTFGYDGELDVLNPLRNDLFDSPELDADSSRWLHFSSGIDAGPVRLTHEVVRGGLYDLETPAGDTVDLPKELTSWHASLSWMVTGEHYDSRSYRQRQGWLLPFPRTEEPTFQHKYGAFELAMRYANGDIDRDLFLLGFTDFNMSSQEFRTFTGALNWYTTPRLRTTLQVVRTIADQFPDDFDSHGRDTSGVLQVQWRL